MKKILSLFTFLLFISQAYSLAGFGVYGDYDLIKYPSGSDSDADQNAIIHKGFDNATGFGLLFYLDVFPIVDLEVDMEFIGNLYKFTPVIAGVDMTDSAGEMPWGRVSTYYTLRREIRGLSIPFLAKVQLYGGLGINNHRVIPTMNLNMFESAFSLEIDSALDQDFGSNDVVNKLEDYMSENIDKISGFHLQTGVQAKLLFLNAFVNARYTIAKDVIPGKSGFPSLWFGVALGI